MRKFYWIKPKGQDEWTVGSPVMWKGAAQEWKVIGWDCEAELEEIEAVGAEITPPPGVTT